MTTSVLCASPEGQGNPSPETKWTDELTTVLVGGSKGHGNRTSIPQTQPFVFICWCTWLSWQRSSQQAARHIGENIASRGPLRPYPTMLHVFSSLPDSAILSLHTRRTSNTPIEVRNTFNRPDEAAVTAKVGSMGF